VFQRERIIYTLTSQKFAEVITDKKMTTLA